MLKSLLIDEEYKHANRQKGSIVLTVKTDMLLFSHYQPHSSILPEETAACLHMRPSEGLKQQEECIGCTVWVVDG